MRYLRKEGETYSLAIPVIFSGKQPKLTEAQEAELKAITAKAAALLDKQYQVCREAVTSEIPAFLRDDEYQIRHAIINVMFPRESVFDEALKRGWLTYDKTEPDGAKRRRLGAWLEIGR